MGRGRQGDGRKGRVVNSRWTRVFRAIFGAHSTAQSRRAMDMAMAPIFFESDTAMTHLGVSSI